MSLLVLPLACNDADRPSARPPPLLPPQTRLGEWSALLPAPIVQLHLHLLVNGKVLSWGRTGDPQIWDPATGGFTAVPAPSWVFCAGHDFLPDGRLLVAGGHLPHLHRLPHTKEFHPPTRAREAVPPHAHGRMDPPKHP